MYNYEDIKQIHLEITQRCQAACSMCDRNMNGGDVNPHLNLDELKISDIKNIFSPDFISQLESMQICGNHGDPIIAEDLLETFKYFREHNSKMWLSMNTNAGARDEHWWQELARTIGRYGTVIFSVDGLEDTNHLYRQGVQWDKVKRAMDSFISAGGRARWDFLVFDYNEHQVEEARQLANNWGFEKFIVKKSSRFITGHTSQKKDEHQAINRKGEKTTLLREPKKENLKNEALKKQELILEKYESMDNFYDVSEIVCRVKSTGSLYISAEGLVLPCCWTAGRMYKWWHKDPKVEQIWKFIDSAGGKDSINAKKVGLKKVFDTGIFEAIEKSWSVQGCSSGRLKVCAMKCSQEFDVVGTQYK